MSERMYRWLVWPLLGFGLLLILIGASLLLDTLSPRAWPWFYFCVSLLPSLLAILLLRRRVRTWRQARLGERATTSTQLSETAENLTPLLFGEYTPYVIEAAEKLADERDMTAVPALLIALQQCVDQQRPGWRDVAEALVVSLARIGDRRALHLLYRLENVRGIGIIPAIRAAIAAIEPQTSLLRPGSVDGSLTETLLRPAHAIPTPDADPRLLLRPTKSD